ncbi:hormogonium polysaccharide biosynthesis glycosyltransferase HpsN [Prochlorothrix hollandica]|uniref:Glycosyltransferase n=1 Tax=Prochlorothrix hollandica PCC 9006 = CALU 1027 TaxID=317619 RepID=A0A0M2PX15_PROHO|nr:hormogonium polysaccharide biosynthesis glycosyltransferase HpsN [Prochlorothrix hollandica]KKI99223.1 glycosyltransferase [Prochlorothrix hollandica PCC 9006 = CALU 1027]
MDQPLVSVIIPTYRRNEPLQKTLEDVLSQTYPRFEVVVVDQLPNHSPGVQAYLDRLATTGQIQLFQPPWASLPGARNYGVRRAQGDIIVFLDDDVELPPDFLYHPVQVFQDRPEVGAVAGRVFDRMKLADAQWLDPQGERVIEQLPPEAMDPAIAWYHLDLVHTVKPQRVITVRGCNMAFRRDIFTVHGLGFDERFRGSAVREESDFCLRLRGTGYQIWYAPEAHLVHLGEESGGCHDISTKSLQYQFTFYHNHFLMGFKNLTPWQCLRFFTKLFDCHVLGHPPCYKNPSLPKTLVRGVFYGLGFLDAVKTLVLGLWTDGQVYSRQER